MAVCKKCDRQSRLHAYFDDERRCPACRPRVYTTPEALGAILSGCVLGGLIVSSPLGRQAWLLVLLGFYATQFLLCVLHEASHAIAAKLVGWQVHFIGLGTGRVRKPVRLGRLLVLLGGKPWRGGYCGTAPTDDAPRPAAVAAVLAAPMVLHAAVAAGAARWAGLDSLVAFAGSVLVVQNVLFLAWAAWPRDATVADRSMPSDGKLLLELWRDREAALRRWRLARWANPVYARIVESRFDSAFAAAQEAAARHPEDDDVLGLLCGAAAAAQRWEVAMPHVGALARVTERARPRELRALADRELAGRGHFRGAELEESFRGGCLAGLDRLDESLSVSERRLEAATSEEARALWSADLAVSLLARGAPADIDRAAEAARFAHERLPWIPLVEAAWGMARIEAGDAKAGLALLERAARRDAEGSTAELRTAWAIAAQKALGRPDRARKLFEGTKVWRTPACRRRAERALA